MRLFTPVALLLALAVVVSGCAAGQQVTAAEIIQKMRETAKTTQTSQGTVDLSLAINKDGLKALVQSFGGNPAQPAQADWADRLPDSVSATLKVWKESPDKARVEVDSSTIPGAKGATLVHDGQKVYAYDLNRNTLYTATPDKMLDRAPDELKAMLQGADIEAELDKLINAANITLAGSEQIAGIDAYKLDITPKPDAADLLGLPPAVKMQAGVLIKDLKAQLWVDQDRWIPLKVVVEHPSVGTFTATMSQMELNKPIEASRFVLQVPSDAKTVDLDAMHDQMKPQALTLPQARDRASAEGWTLLEPSYVPDNATLIEVRAMPAQGSDNAKGSGIILNYSSPSADFSLIQGKSKYEGMLGDGFSGINGRGSDAFKEVEVRGVKAMAFSPQGSNWTAIAWQEKDSGMWVAIHGKLTVDETLKIAEGLK
jgi:outer membrane lipoprotein-sorting protein